jgi:hypothetical protein
MSLIASTSNIALLGIQQVEQVGVETVKGPQSDEQVLPFSPASHTPLLQQLALGTLVQVPDRTSQLFVVQLLPSSHCESVVHVCNGTVRYGATHVPLVETCSYIVFGTRLGFWLNGTTPSLSVDSFHNKVSYIPLKYVEEQISGYCTH